MSFKQKLEEQVGFNFGFAKNTMLPVEYSQFPSSQNTPQETPTTEPLKPIITQGETTELNQPREDKQLETNTDQTAPSEIIAEIGSLLISIGYILASNKLIDDKYNKTQVLDYLNKQFVETTQQDEPQCTEGQPTTDQPVIGKPQFATVYLQERRSLEQKLLK
jgi:hypothetical protein